MIERRSLIRLGLFMPAIIAANRLMKVSTKLIKPDEDFNKWFCEQYYFMSSEEFEKFRAIARLHAKNMSFTN